MNRPLLFWYAAVFACGVRSFDVFAFDANLHKEYTASAFGLYLKHCAPKLPKARRTVVGEIFAQGSQDEDDTQLLLRAQNWHFYNRYGSVKNNWANTTLDWIFEERARHLNEAIASRPIQWEVIYARAGRVVHYLQDMSVPAHVAPIYHVKLRLLFYSADKRDLLDGYPYQAELSKFLTAGGCADLRRDIPKRGYANLRSMLDATAQHTIQAIRRPPWRRYWGDPAENSERDQDLPGFANYGPCHFIVGHCDNKDTLDEFFAERYRRVIEDTVRVLLYLESSVDMDAALEREGLWDGPFTH